MLICWIKIWFFTGVLIAFRHDSDQVGTGEHFALLLWQRYCLELLVESCVFTGCKLYIPKLLNQAWIDQGIREVCRIVNFSWALFFVFLLMKLFSLQLFDKFKFLQLDTFYHVVLNVINFLFRSKGFLVFVRSSYPGCPYVFTFHMRLLWVIYHIFKRLSLILINWIKFFSVSLRLYDRVYFFFLILIKLRKLFVIASILFNLIISLRFRSIFLSILAW